MSRMLSQMDMGVSSPRYVAAGVLVAARAIATGFDDLAAGGIAWLLPADLDDGAGQLLITAPATTSKTNADTITTVTVVDTEVLLFGAPAAELTGITGVGDAVIDALDAACRLAAVNLPVATSS